MRWECHLKAVQLGMSCTGSANVLWNGLNKPCSHVVGISKNQCSCAALEALNKQVVGLGGFSQVVTALLTRSPMKHLVLRDNFMFLNVVLTLLPHFTGSSHTQLCCF